MTTSNSSTGVNGNSTPKEWRRPAVGNLPPDQAVGVRDRLLTEEERKELYAAAITEWVTAERERRHSDALTSAEIAGLDSWARVVGLRTALLDLVCRFYRKNDGADCRPGVMFLVTVFSDSRDGCCRISAGRMAEMLGKRRESVTLALGRLVDDGLLNSEQVSKGMPVRYWPVVNRAFVDPKMTPWIFLEALSATPAPRGKPVRPDAQVSKKVCEQANTFPTNDVRMNAQVLAQRCAGEPVKVCDPPHTSLLRNLLVEEKKEKRDARALAIADQTQDSGWELILDRIPSILKAAERWQPANTLEDTAQRREHFSGGLKGKLQTSSAEVVLAAINDVVPDLETIEPARKAFGAYSKLFWMMLAKAIDENFKREVGRRTEVAISERRLGAWDKRAAEKRGLEAPALRLETAEFKPDEKLKHIGFGTWMEGRHGNDLMRQVPGVSKLDVRYALDGLEENSKACFGDILALAQSRLEARLAHARHGDPETLCGGKPAAILGSVRHAEMRTEWFAISQETMEILEKRYPLVPYSARIEAWLTVAKIAEERRVTYGPQQQSELEALFEKEMARAQEKAAADKTQAAEAERQIEEERADRELNREAKLEAMNSMPRCLWNELGPVGQIDTVLKIKDRMKFERGINAARAEIEAEDAWRAQGP